MLMDAYQTWHLDAVHIECMGRSMEVFPGGGEAEILWLKPQIGRAVAVEACCMDDTWPWQEDSAVASGTFGERAGEMA
jgi:hypothetical protein